MRIAFLAALAGACLAATASAQPPKFDLNPDRIDLTSEDAFADSKTYLVPTVYLHLAARNTAFAKNQGARATARIFTKGLDKAYAQGLAKQVQDDLVAKIRAAGFTVLTYDDAKADLAGFDRMKPNEALGYPTRAIDSTPGIDFAIVTPTDEQAFDYSFATGPAFPYRHLAKAKDLVVVIPQVFLNYPEVASSKGGTLTTNSVSLSVTPKMILYYAWVFAQAGGDAGNIRIQTHGGRPASLAAGTASKIAQNHTNDDWYGTDADFAFTIDPAEFSNGVLRVGYAINDFTVATIKDEH